MTLTRAATTSCTTGRKHSAERPDGDEERTTARSGHENNQTSLDNPNYQVSEKTSSNESDRNPSKPDRAAASEETFTALGMFRARPGKPSLPTSLHDTPAEHADPSAGDASARGRKPRRPGDPPHLSAPQPQRRNEPRRSALGPPLRESESSPLHPPRHRAHCGNGCAGGGEGREKDTKRTPASRRRNPGNARSGRWERVCANALPSRAHARVQQLFEPPARGGTHETDQDHAGMNGVAHGHDKRMRKAGHRRPAGGEEMGTMAMMRSTARRIMRALGASGRRKGASRGGTGRWGRRFTHRPERRVGATPVRASSHDAWPAPRSGHRRAMAHAALALLAFAGVPALADTLVSNIGQGYTSFATIGQGTTEAQGFRTGGNALGYTMSGIDLYVEGIGSSANLSNLTVSLRAKGSGNRPAASDLAVFGKPSHTELSRAGVKRFALASPVNLARNSTYFVVVRVTGIGIDLRLGWTTNNEEDSGKAPGWRIHNDSIYAGGGSWYQTSYAFRIAVIGTTRMPQEPNTASQGMPTISGTARVGETLTASTSGITDLNGLAGVSYSYEWIRVDGAIETPIARATSSTYRLTSADRGHRVKVKVTFEDDEGYEEEATSDAFPASGTVAAVVLPAPVCTGHRLEHWCATLGVEETDAGGREFGYGFFAADGDGSLSDESFTYDNTQYAVRALYVVPVGNGGALVLKLDPVGTTVFDNEYFSVHIGSTELAFEDASVTGGNEWGWPVRDGLSLRDGETVTVRITEKPRNSPRHRQAHPVRHRARRRDPQRLDRSHRRRERACQCLVRLRVAPGRRGGRVRHSLPERKHLPAGRIRRGDNHPGAGLVHRRRRVRGVGDERCVSGERERRGRGSPGPGPRHRQAGHPRHRRGRGDAQRLDERDFRRERPRERDLRLPVGAGRRRERDRHLGRDLEHLPAGRRRRGQEGQGEGVVHRRRRVRGVGDERCFPAKREHCHCGGHNAAQARERDG